MHPVPRDPSSLEAILSDLVRLAIRRVPFDWQLFFRHPWLSSALIGWAGIALMAATVMVVWSWTNPVPTWVIMLTGGATMLMLSAGILLAIVDKGPSNV